MPELNQQNQPTQQTTPEKASSQLIVQLLLRVSALEKLLIGKNIFTADELGKILTENLQELKSKLDSELENIKK